MAINKARTPVWMKVVLVVLAIVFVFGFVSIGASPFISGQKSESTSTADPLSKIGAQYQPTVSSLTSVLQSEPESYTALVTLGNTYFDWALAVQQQSQSTSSAAGADQQLWVSAKDAYSRALKVKAGDPSVTIDYSITAFYTGDTNTAVDLANGVVKSNPEFPPAYMNLGVFYEALGEKDKAIAAYEQYVKLDPKGTQGNLEYVKQQLAALKGGGSTTTP